MEVEVGSTARIEIRGMRKPTAAHRFGAAEYADREHRNGNQSGGSPEP